MLDHQPLKRSRPRIASARAHSRNACARLFCWKHAPFYKHSRQSSSQSLRAPGPLRERAWPSSPYLAARRSRSARSFSSPRIRCSCESRKGRRVRGKRTAHSVSMMAQIESGVRREGVIKKRAHGRDVDSSIGTGRS
eukprot:5768742-Pleurochrysis_carterae.AAC.1